jgi:zinc protease
MIDRSIAPNLETINHIDFLKPRIFEISSNVHLYWNSDVPNNTSRVDLYFDAGTILGDIGIASFVNGLLLSGTKDRSSIEINASIDALGGFFESGVSNENAVISIYALKDNMLPVLRIIQNAISGAIFPEHEVDELLIDRKQKFLVSMEKVNFLAQRAFQQRLFSNSIYGRVSDVKDFDHISRKDIVAFHNEHYLNGLSKVVVVGDLGQDTVDQIIDIFGDWSHKHLPSFESNIQNLRGAAHVVKDDAVQSAIRVGRMLFNKTHPDYLDFNILNTILGDYFGSRLMSNIREDKGYTYGIGTMMAELHSSGYFLIATEVGKDVREATLVEIQKEIEILQNELVPEDELELVKNYLLGQLLKSADGPYSMTDLYMGVEPFNLEMDFYNKAIESINGITAERIQELAKKYLNWSEMTIVSAG